MTVVARKDLVAGKEKVRNTTNITTRLNRAYKSCIYIQVFSSYKLIKSFFFYLAGFRRSRSASPGSSSRKYSPRRWFSRKSLEPVEIKVYEVDDMEKVQRAMEPNFQV